MRLLKVLAGVLIALILSAGISYAQYSPTAKQITVDTSGYTKLNNTKTNVKDVLADIDSKINTASSLTGQVPLGNGGTGLSSASDDTTIISNGTAWQSKTIPSCTDSGGNHLNYDQSSNSFSCGTSGSSRTKTVTTVSDATSITPNSGTSDIVYQLNTQSAGTLTINADIGTPQNGQSLLFKIKSSNIQTLSWNSLYAGGNSGLPTSTTGSSLIDYFSFIYDSVNSKWQYTGAIYGY